MTPTVRSIALALAVAAGLPAAAATVAIEPVKDNTLYEDPTGSLSNGAGQHIFAGTTVSFGTRRAVLAFDVAAAVPPGVEIISAELRLEMSKTISGTHPVAVHRLLADWGEGSADAPGEEGAGAPASGGDATWIHTFSPAQFWLIPGGDFEPVPSATTGVTDVGQYSWTGPGLLDDVRAWHLDPTSNFGWIVIGDESEIATAKRFDSRESSSRPVLILTTDGDGDGGAVPAASTAGLVVLVLALAGAAAFVRRP